MRVAKAEKQKLINALKKKPRSTRDLIKLHGGMCLSILREINKTEPILCKKVWDDGWTFAYWIKPQRMGKSWKYVYSKLSIPVSYDITMDQI